MALSKQDHPPDDHARMRQLTDHHRTKADKIRTLGRAGYTRTQIAEFLGIRYQHVRNVLVQEAKAQYRATPEPQTEADEYGRAAIDDEGRIVLPPSVMMHLELRNSGVVGWRVEGDEVVLMGPQAGIRRARELLASSNVQSEVSLVDELIRERREEARKEDERDRRYGSMDT